MAFLGLAGYALAEDTPVKFAPPPFPMTNLVVNDAVQGWGLDYMSLEGGGLKLKALNIGQGSIDRYWNKGGFAGMFAEQLIYGTFDMGGFGGSGDPMTMFGIGFSMPLNLYFDGVSKEADDNSFPIYFGLHFNLMEMFGTMDFQTMWNDYNTYQYIPFYGYITIPHYSEVTDTLTMMMMNLNIGWQIGVQGGINLGSAIKFVPYLDISQDVYALSLMTMSAIYTDIDNSTSENLGPLPITAAPGFDIILRKLGLSLGAMWQTTKLETGGEFKQFNVHLRWSETFRSICGL